MWVGRGGRGGGGVHSCLCQGRGAPGRAQQGAENVTMELDKTGNKQWDKT